MVGAWCGAAVYDVNLVMTDVTVAHAKEHLDELIELAARGDDVRIVHPAYGAVRLGPTVGAGHTNPEAQTSAPSAQQRDLGRFNGKYTVPARLMEPMTDRELEDWYGPSR
jgi:hypothetical protein